MGGTGISRRGQDLYGAQMRPMAMLLADAQAIRNVVAYIITLGN